VLLAAELAVEAVEGEHGELAGELLVPHGLERVRQDLLPLRRAVEMSPVSASLPITSPLASVRRTSAAAAAIARLLAADLN